MGPMDGSREEREHKAWAKIGQDLPPNKKLNPKQVNKVTCPKLCLIKAAGCCDEVCHLYPPEG